MALADYYLCDICGSKCFYDAELNWSHKTNKSDFVRGRDMALDNCGDMAALCKDCAQTHKIVIQPISGLEE